MIRTATKFDIPQIFDLLRHYRDAASMEGMNIITDIENESTPLSIMTYILAGAGLALVNDLGDGKLSGMLLAVKTPHLWDQTKYIMSEICLWVDPEYRGGTAGFRLIKEYVDRCDQLKDQQQITNYTLSQMQGQSLKYERFGFKPTETTWSQ